MRFHARIPRPEDGAGTLPRIFYGAPTLSCGERHPREWRTYPRTSPREFDLRNDAGITTGDQPNRPSDQHYILLLVDGAMLPYRHGPRKGK